MPIARVLAAPIVATCARDHAIDANDRSALMLESAMSRQSTSGILNDVFRWVAPYRRRLWIQHMVVCCLFCVVSMWLRSEIRRFVARATGGQRPQTFRMVFDV